MKQVLPKLFMPLTPSGGVSGDTGSMSTCSAAV